MSEHTSNEVIPQATMDGNGSPFGISYGKIMMWFFLVSDALTFGGFLTAYAFIRHEYAYAWPMAEEYFTELPFLHGEYPLAYVALMTFILIVSSVTMVLAVESGHRMNRKGVIRWMLATIIGGMIFVGSQAYEWTHFIEGTNWGKVVLADGSVATVKGEFGEIHNFQVVTPGTHYTKAGEKITEENSQDGDLMDMFKNAAKNYRLSGTAGNMMITLSDGTVAKVNKAADKDVRLFVIIPGAKHPVSSPDDQSSRITEKQGSDKLYYEALANGSVTYGANLKGNEYGPSSYAEFFFFVTGFHGFHVTIGVIVNIIIFINVLMGVYDRRGHYEMVEKGGLYWHFVDLVWVFVFTFLYLI